LITVHPETKKVRISPELKNTRYKEIDGKKLNLPELAQEESPLRQEVLKWHYKHCEWITD
jgi:hypothetical protein